MGNISSNSIFHFTSSKENLQGILRDFFKIKYCRELMPFLEEQIVLYIPMVSFCEIPLSQVKEHISKYGGYGIGLERSWAIRNRLNPVAYVERNSCLSSSYYDAIRTFFTKFDELEGDERNGLKNFCEFLRYMKPYQGRLERKSGNSVENYRFADEREWRYVTPLDSNVVPLFYEEHYAQEKSSADASLENERLLFQPGDIKYIFVRSDPEICEIFDFLRKQVDGKYSQDESEILMSRIVTTKQIEEDF
jgi:hypothetical protein